MTKNESKKPTIRDIAAILYIQSPHKRYLEVRRAGQILFRGTAALFASIDPVTMPFYDEEPSYVMLAEDGTLVFIMKE